MKFSALFSGIGGFHLGLQKAGFKVNSYNSEIDKYAIEVYKHNFKNSTYVKSVKDVQSKQLPKIDAITFGSPGQLSKPLQTLGVIDLNGNCLIQSGFYPKIERESILSDILQEKVEDKYFLSEKGLKQIQHQKEKGIPVPVSPQHMGGE